MPVAARQLIMTSAKRQLWPQKVVSILLIASAILGIQLAGGAYQAEFTFLPDEPGQFVSGLMVYDYITQLPSGNPLDWAIRYYLHYPRVAIGRWPPGFPASEALWWLVFGPTRASALLLLGFMVGIGSALFYRVAERIVPWWLAAAATLLMIVSPVVSESFISVMADAPCFLTSVLLLDALVRLTVTREGSVSGEPGGLRLSKRLLLWIAAVLLFGLLTKGTAIALIPAPLIALAWNRRLAHLKWHLAAVAGVAAAIAGGLFLLKRDAFIYIVWGLAGVRMDLPWPVFLVLSLMGAGCCVMAAVGLWFTIRNRNPIAIAAASMMVSTLVVSYFLRAMLEPRHWLVVLPALVLLAAYGISRIAGQTAWKLALACAVVLIPFPFQFIHQQSSGYADFIRKMPLPARMMVSSGDSSGEGPLIALVALHDHRVASTIVRANKVLASQDWNGEAYHLLVTEPSAVERQLDELRVDLVVLHERPGAPVMPHQTLLRQTLQHSSEWRKFTQAGMLEAWRRVKPASVPAKPLQVDLRNRIGRIISE